MDSARKAPKDDSQKFLDDDGVKFKELSPDQYRKVCLNYGI
ncbi:unnamed protein product [Anisakis simplex]|uniref:NADH dehydrogenase (quinone) n=1 Tax=Anisakis simplex TaxID=6269 RepID=A0A0M3J4X3_ANISI|nr:unnamed protein product [Anisakis simplex]